MAIDQYLTKVGQVQELNEMKPDIFFQSSFPNIFTLFTSSLKKKNCFSFASNTLTLLFFSPFMTKDVLTRKTLNI